MLPRLVWHYGEPFADSSARAELLPRGVDSQARHSRAQRATVATSASLGTTAISYRRTSITARLPDLPVCATASRPVPKGSGAGARPRSLRNRTVRALVALGEAPSGRHDQADVLLHTSRTRCARRALAFAAELPQPSDRRLRSSPAAGRARRCARYGQRDARCRHPDLPAGRPAGQDGHRDAWPTRSRSARRCSTTFCMETAGCDCPAPTRSSPTGRCKPMRC